MTVKPKPSFKAIEPISLKDLALSAIREAILGGALSPGERITESRLSKQMHVGQNVVREALQELEFQGFVERVPNKGTFVTHFSREDINQIYRLRMELEGLAAQLARETERPTPEEVSQLELALTEMQAGADTGDFWKFSRSDLEFHEIIWRISGNRFLEKALRAVATPQFSYVLIRSFHHTRLDLAAITQEHRELLQVLKTAEPVACRQFVTKKVESFWQQINRGIDDKP
ncbi:MAG TPA: GntR family transcriptional regulator [Terriglobia bacterium]|nr:GntR family transcriptional regulator [Terriglobia bacterium]